MQNPQTELEVAKLLEKLNSSDVLISYEDYPIDDHTQRDETLVFIKKCTKAKYIAPLKTKILTDTTREYSLKNAYIFIYYIANNLNKNEVIDFILDNLIKEKNDLLIREVLSTITSTSLEIDKGSEALYNLFSFPENRAYANSIRFSALVLFSKLNSKHHEIVQEKLFSFYETLTHEQYNHASIVFGILGSFAQINSIPFIKSILEDDSYLKPSLEELAIETIAKIDLENNLSYIIQFFSAAPKSKQKRAEMPFHYSKVSAILYNNPSVQSIDILILRARSLVNQKDRIRRYESSKINKHFLETAKELSNILDALLPFNNSKMNELIDYLIKEKQAVLLPFEIEWMKSKGYL